MDRIELADDTPSTPAQSVPHEVSADLQCMTCGYSLRGLTRDSLCPECGTPVRDSVRGDLLFYRNTEYVKTLKRGLSLILNGLLLYIIIMLAVVFSGVAVGAGLIAGTTNSIEYMGTIGIVGVSVMILLGWWLFTQRDPGVSEEHEPKARQITRIAVVANLAVALGSFVVESLVILGISSVILDILSFVFSLLWFAAFGTQFFAGMLYLRRLARRLPSPKIHQLAKNRMIACPIWFTVGIILLGLGPLIALILYWNLLDMVRKALKTIIAAKESGQTDPPTITVRR